MRSVPVERTFPSDAVSPSTTVVDGVAWIPKLILPDDYRDKVTGRATVSCRVLDPDTQKPRRIAVPGWIEDDEYIGLPRALYLNIRRGTTPTVWRKPEDTHRELECAISPINATQEQVVAATIEQLSRGEYAGGIMNAATGTGKTMMALMTAAHFKCTTMVVVPSTALLEQWIARTLGDESEPDIPAAIPTARVGVFGGGTEQWGDDYDIIVATAQTLTNRPSDHPIFGWAKLCIFDEVHNFAAPTFAACIQKIWAPKRLGLSATVERWDEAEQLFIDAIGPVYINVKAPQLQPSIKVVKTSFTVDVSRYPLKMRPVIRDTAMSKDHDRNRLLSSIIHQSYEADRNTLVLSKRVDHLVILKRMLMDLGVPESDIGVSPGKWYVNEDDGFEFIKNKKFWASGLKNSDGSFKLELLDPKVHQISRTPKPRSQEVDLSEAIAFLEDGAKAVSFEIDAKHPIKPRSLEIKLVSNLPGQTTPLDRTYSVGNKYIVNPETEEQERVGRYDKKSGTLSIDLVSLLGAESLTLTWEAMVPVDVEPKQYMISKEEFNAAKECRIILSTYKKVAEGYDVPILDTLVQAMPKGNPTQAVGRILRPHPDKKDPVVVHVVDRLKESMAMWKSAKRRYIDIGATNLK